MDTRTFRRILTYGSAGLVAVIALVFGSRELLPAPPSQPIAMATTVAVSGHSNPWSIDRSPARVSAGAAPAPRPMADEPDESARESDDLGPSDTNDDEPNHINRLPQMGATVDAPQSGDGGGDAIDIDAGQ